MAVEVKRFVKMRSLRAGGVDSAHFKVSGDWCSLQHYLQQSRHGSNLKYPLTDEWIKKTWCIYMQYSVIKKEWNNAICSNMDGPRDDHTKWNKSERERQISNDITYMWNLKKWNGLEGGEVKVARPCPTLFDPKDYTVHGILQARILEWVAIPLESNPGLPHCRQIVHQPQGKPRITGVGTEGIYVY